MRVISEMARVTRPGGMIHLLMPTYTNFFEGHYRMWMPPLSFCSRGLARLWLKANRRPVDFINHLKAVPHWKYIRAMKNAGLRLKYSSATNVRSKAKQKLGFLGILASPLAFFYTTVRLQSHEFLVQKNSNPS